MTPKELFQNLACDTWNRLQDAYGLSISFGETSITDFLLLEIKRANLKNISVLKTSQINEPKWGTDWEWWIGSKDTGWLRYAIQAKKLNTSNGNYKYLKHKVKKKSQIDILDEYANSHNAIPLYCFYNYLDLSAPDNYWKCKLTIQLQQLGCTFTPSFIVREALKLYGKRTFQHIHSKEQSLPWHCLVGCPSLRSLYATNSVNGKELAMKMFGREITNYPELPSCFDEARTTGELKHFSLDWYPEQLNLYPKQIAIVDFSST